ncbi:MAG TPA: helix-turn-helix domain-containing protein [Actinophytocola sp.]|nr:helix-turn-helix domain-containing protein [Actinophytocola sp.]
MHAPWTLIQASHVVVREFTAVFAEVGLTPTQFGVLVQLEDREPRTQADLTRGGAAVPAEHE